MPATFQSEFNHAYEEFRHTKNDTISI